MVDNRLLSQRRSHSTTFVNYFIHILCFNSSWRNYLVDFQCSKGTIHVHFTPSYPQFQPVPPQFHPKVEFCIDIKWKKCYRLIQYLPIESASNFIRDNTLSDLHLILAMVELNGCRQKVKTITNKKVKIYS